MGSFCRHQTFSSTTPHFFLIILDDTSRDVKIGVPKKFVMKYGEDVSNVACLTLPSGAEWEVEFIRCNNGNAWFEKGWPDFSKFYSLDHGDFLVLRYEGNSKFQVCIFDKTTTEIDYPIKKEEGDPEGVEEEEEDVSIEILEKSPLPSTPLLKKIRTSPAALGVMCSLDDSEKARALSRADAFIPENPHFKVVMQSSYVCQSSLSCPLKFFKRIRIYKDVCDVVLRVSNGKTWSVKLKCNKFRATLQRGWLAFVKDNCLKVGDVCVFVLVKGTKLLFEVEVFRAASSPSLPGQGRDSNEQVEDNIISIVKVEPDSSMNSGKNKRKTTYGKVTQRDCSSLRVPRANLAAAKKFIPSNPFFKVTLGDYHREKANVHVPQSITRSSIKRFEKQTMMLEVENRLWPVTFILYSTTPYSAKFSAGWSAFAREHDLKGGDVCVFELMERKEANIVLKVHMFKCD